MTSQCRQCKGTGIVRTVINLEPIPLCCNQCEAGNLIWTSALRTIEAASREADGAECLPPRDTAEQYVGKRRQ
jgi:hypothetical protein